MAVQSVALPHQTVLVGAPGAGSLLAVLAALLLLALSTLAAAFTVSMLYLRPLLQARLRLCAGRCAAHACSLAWSWAGMAVF